MFASFREFLVWALRIEGRSAEALEEARKLTVLAQPCAVDHVHCEIPGCHKADANDPLGGRRFERFSAAWPLTVALLGDQAELTELEELPPPATLQYVLTIACPQLLGRSPNLERLDWITLVAMIVESMRVCVFSGITLLCITLLLGVCTHDLHQLPPGGVLRRFQMSPCIGSVQSWNGSSF